MQVALHVNLLSSRHPVLVAAGSLVAIVSVAAVAQAATDTIYKYSTPKHGTFLISALALAPENHDVDYQVQFNGGSARLNAGVGLLHRRELAARRDDHCTVDSLQERCRTNSVIRPLPALDQ